MLHPSQRMDLSREQEKALWIHTVDLSQKAEKQ